MKVITGPRQSGKTTEAIETANGRGAHLVVHSEAFKRQVKEHYPEVENRIVTVHELTNGSLRGIEPRRFVIDDLDMFMSKIVGGQGKTVGVAINADEVENLA